MDRPVFNRRRSSNPTSPILMARHSSNANRSKSKTRRTSLTDSLTILPYTSSSEINIADNILNVNLDNSLPLDFFKKDVLSIIKSLKIPKWRKIDIKLNYKLIRLDRISGAMTNCIYKITYKNYYPILLRLYGDVENIIDRNSELLTLIRLSKKNIGPKLLGCFNNGRFEEFLNNSITLNKFQIKDSKISRMIARRMKEFHYGVNLTFDEYNNGPKSWLLIEKWLNLVDSLIKNSTIDEQKNVFIQDWNSFKSLVLIYKNWLYDIYGSSENLKDSLKFCHNDTQYGNLLFYSKSDRLPMDDDSDNDNDNDNENENENENDDTKIENTLIDDNEITSLSLSNQIDQLSIKNIPSQLPLITDTNFKYDTRLTVIDFEYAGQNPPAYDITNHFSEWMYDYHDLNFNYKTDETKYPSVEERLNYLNSYIQYIPGSTTPNLIPQSANSNNSSSSISSHPPSLNKSRSVVSIKLSDLPSNVTHLYNETIYWRSTSSIFWALWAVISKGSISLQKNNLESKDLNDFKSGPNGEQYKVINDNINDTVEDDSDEEFSKPTLDDEFDHLQYALGKIGIFIGDMIQFGLLNKDQIDLDKQINIKYLDTKLL
ncbi:hypothetical protein C6P40_000310 [Pichia californica]|uniref:Choline kinase N-terminal domain-containing protein n=1 Tax=Pichia californica TaxID=460514 RepID=A0A9P6WMR8_9ASCO|nr:hypothetical protein C6P42_000395 [[Candida] californica]KAG0688972.1 hypothetical protein C6P40_000310 [[Candida] californica]